jgi:hypothetical protein
MAMTNNKADDGYRALYNAQCAAQLMYMDLRDADDGASAAEAEKRANDLGDQIDTLVHKELAAWQADADKVIPELNKAAADAQSAVNNVETDVQNAQKISSAMKALDQVITAAAKFLA